MNKLVIFDLDGVLIDSKLLHFDALNLALKEIDQKFVITKEEQSEIYEGLPTKVKLELLTKQKGLDRLLYDQIWKSKQEKTLLLFNNIIKDIKLKEYFQQIRDNGIKIAVASNSIKQTVDTCLTRLDVFDMVDCIVSNEDVIHPKPHPEMYWKAMSFLNAVPDTTIIFEDSIVGKLAVRDSKARLIDIVDRQDLNIDKIEKAIKLLLETNIVWEDDNLNVLIPMAGLGSRFRDAGYSFPKPLIDIDGKPMIQVVVDNLNIKANFTYIVQQEHYEKYELQHMLNRITPNCNIVQVNGLTEGAAVTALMAKEFINNDKPLIIANSDQVVDWSSRSFLYEMITKNADGGIVTFKSTHPKWSYAKINSVGHVLEVAEKKTISDIATVGIYYWKHGKDFVKYAEQMIAKNIRTNNEFYICPIFNEAIGDNQKVLTHDVERMWGVGTPEDLNYYLNNRGSHD